MVQLATLLLAITAFAVPSLGCNPASALLPDPVSGYESYKLAHVQLGAGGQTYTCNPATGTYK